MSAQPTRSRDVPPQTKPKARTQGKAATPARRWRLNLRALIVLASLLAVASAAILVSWAMQASRGRHALLVQARTLADQKKDDLALSFLKEYLAGHPRDLEALEPPRRAARPRRPAPRISSPRSSATASWCSGSTPTPPGPRGQAVRRRLIEAHLAQGPLIPASERKYGTAEELAGELAAQTRTAADLRLHAQTLEPRWAGPATPRTSPRPPPATKRPARSTPSTPAAPSAWPSSTRSTSRRRTRPSPCSTTCSPGPSGRTRRTPRRRPAPRRPS